METDVDLHEHIKRTTGAANDTRPRVRHFNMVDDDGDGPAVHQSQDAWRIGRIDWIGKTDVDDARGRHHLGLSHFRAADAYRATVDLPLRNDRRLMRL
jgi:hypothetical protein